MWWRRSARRAVSPQRGEIAPEILFAPDALRRAWRIVRRNGPSAGVDRVTVCAFEKNLESQLEQVRGEVLSRSYRSLPALRYYRPKANGKLRPITVWAVRDRLVQRVIHDWLLPILDTGFLECSFGFRPGRNVEQALRAVQMGITLHKSWIVDADIADCFDSVPVAPLLDQVRSAVPSELAIHLIGQWLTTPLHKRSAHQTGVSQGSVLSPLLVNLYLHTFDQQVNASLSHVTLVRFADDFVMLCQYKGDAETALRLAQTTLQALGLRLNPEKTRILNAGDGFTFLGVQFRGSKWRREVAS